MKFFINTILSLLLLNLTCNFCQEVTVTDENYRLIQLNLEEPAQWISKSQYFNLISNYKHFIDRTYNKDFISLRSKKKTFSNPEFPKIIKYKSQAQRAIKELNKSRASTFLTKLSSFHTRYYTSKTGAQAVKFIKDYLKDIIKDYKYSNMVEIIEFKHEWIQSSLIVRFKGVKRASEIVVLGAHLDSINGEDPENGRSPGADDDGSGVTLLTELIHALLKSNFQPSRTLEFQFYSAEEAGLLGSQQIAQSYSNQTKNVIAMLQHDMIGYATKEDRQIQVVNDFTNPDLTQFVRVLIKTYTNSSVGEDMCGYGCSDHASYYELGYRAAYIFEAKFSPAYHSDKDTIDYVDFDYLLEVCKVSLGFAIELAEPGNSQ